MFDKIEYGAITTLLGGELWEASVEALTLSFIKHNVAIIKCTPEVTDILTRAREDLGTVDPRSLAEGAPSPWPTARLQQGKVVVDHRLGLPLRFGSGNNHTNLDQAFVAMDNIARVVLAAVCRSCHVRLPSYVFTPALDDMPLRTGTPSSSVLQAVRYLPQQARQQAGSPEAPQWQLLQEGACSSGLVSAMTAQGVRHQERGFISKIQVRDRAGGWTTVHLAKDELVLFLGQAAERATAGLLRAAAMRTVGEPHAGAGHRSLEFCLRARPGARLDLAEALRAAGHSLGPRRAEALSVSSLVRQFEDVLTPATGAERPTRRSSSVASLGEVRPPAPPAEASQPKRAKKRASLDPPPGAASPVTRSGKVARTSLGLVNKERSGPLVAPPQPRRSGSAPEKQDQEEQAAGPEHSLTSSYGDMSGVAFLAREEARQAPPPGWEHVSCVAVDGRKWPTDDWMVLRFVHKPSHMKAAFRMHPTTPLSRVFAAFCDTIGLDLGAVKFVWDDPPFTPRRLMGYEPCRSLPNGGRIVINVDDIIDNVHGRL